MSRKPLATVILFFAACMCAYATGITVPAQPATPKLYRATVDPHWLSDDQTFWYQNENAGGVSEYVIVDAEHGTRKVASHADITRLDPSSASSEQHPVAAKLATKTSSPSPDGKYEAFVRDHNLWIRELAGHAESPLSFDASSGNTFHADTARLQMIEQEYDSPEKPPTLADVYWSPDSQLLVAMQTRTVPERRVYLVESSPSDQLQPKLQSFPYLKPGDDVPVPRPRLFSIRDRRELPIDQALFSNPWNIDEVRWSSESGSFDFLYNQRGHQLLRVIRVDALTGAANASVEERSPTFIDYTGKYYNQALDESHERIWMSERDGWNHLYLYDTMTGNVKNQITRGQWVVRGVERVDAQKRQIVFRAGGIVPGQDPYYVQYARINFDGTGLTLLTRGDGNHSVRWSPDERFFIDTWSRVDLPPVTQLRRAADGSLLLTLEHADAEEVLRERGRFPERFLAKGRDGATDIYGVIFWPKKGIRSRTLPVLERIYAGPHGFFVPKAFHASYLEEEALADSGFVVVQIDGMGTSGRSKAFHDVAWKNLADAGFPDRVAWIKAMAAKYRVVDSRRVGLYGRSAGGQNALAALLWHNDFYSAAIADSGCHDNRMDKIWWNEQWLGWPIGPQYAANSNVDNAWRMKGNLLLVTGELDRNVDPASTMQVANALIKANKNFELLIVPGAGHGAMVAAVGTVPAPYSLQRMRDFFTRSLK
jgi:dipeptidyl-peptidase-4